MIDSSIKITSPESPKHVTGHNSIYIEYNCLNIANEMRSSKKIHKRYTTQMKRDR